MDVTTVEAVAHDLIRLSRAEAFDPTEHRDEIRRIVAPFVTDEATLQTLFEERGLDVGLGANTSRVLYYSPEMVMLLSRFDTDFALPRHNHEMWNFLLICRGAMHFRWYRRDDDGSVPGQAELVLGEDRIITAGEIGYVGPPPNDIHQLAITQPGSWMLTVSPRPEPSVREVYDATGAYERRVLSPATGE